jgi:acyl transferase domain-containing protein
MAVACGTNLILSPLPFISESNLSMLSPTGRSRMWDADADGCEFPLHILTFKTLS